MQNILLILFSILFSCGITNNSNYSERKSIIKLQRTACFGTCPIYTIEIFSNGDAVYTGTRFVENIGIKKFKLSQDNINEILIFSEEIEFSKLENEYSEPISDLSTTYIRIKEKEIKDYVGAPRKLKRLEKLIDQICFAIINY